MNLTISPTKRQKIIDALSTHIRAGKLQSGTRLASMRQMSTEFNASLSVVQSAMRELVNSGLVECKGAGGFYVRDFDQVAVDAPRPNATPPPTGGKIFLSCHHHSDLVWKYPARVYDAIRAGQIEAAEELFEQHPDFRIFFDQSEVLRRYCDAHPERLDRLRRRVAAGQLELAGGFCIPDLNIVGGECLVRNLQFGRAYYRRTFGVAPTLASFVDAFGMCAQLPQVLRQSGYTRLIPGRMPGLPRELAANQPLLWRGPDGSEIPLSASQALVNHFGYDYNVPIEYSGAERLGQTLADLKLTTGGNVFAIYMTEVEPIDSNLFWLIEAANRCGARPIEFGLPGAYFDTLEPGSLPVFNGEFNPTMTGCYTTRIRVKQALRRVEHALLTSETLCAMAQTDADLDAAWQAFLLSTFHDAAAGCHTDAVNAEVMAQLDFAAAAARQAAGDAWAELTGGGVTVVNTAGFGGPMLVHCPAERDFTIPDLAMQRDGDQFCFVADLPQCGVAGWAIGDGAPPPARPGSERFSTRHLDIELRDAKPYWRRRGTTEDTWQPAGGELLLRHDPGSMWVEELFSNYLGDDCTVEEVESIETGAVFTLIRIRGTITPDAEQCPGVDCMSYTKEYRFYHALDFYALRIGIDWRGRNTKVALRLPVTLDPLEAEALYSVPFGAMSRRPYYEIPSHLSATARVLRNSDYESAHGDWPTLGWIDYSDHRGGLSVANRETPGCQMVDRSIYLSLLRSGLRCADGMMHPDPGVLEPGYHQYDFALRPHVGKAGIEAARLGALWNQPPVATVHYHAAPPAAPRDFLSWNAGNILLSSLRPAPGGGILVRFYEAFGRTTELALRMNGFRRCEECDLEELDFREADAAALHFRPFEIRTFRLTRAAE